MKSLTIIKAIGLSALIAAAVYAFYGPEAVSPLSVEASGVASAVSGPGNQPRAEAGKTLVVGMPPEYERPQYSPPEEKITAQTPGVTEVKVGTTSFLVYGTGVYFYSADEEKWCIIAELPVPDESHHFSSSAL